MSEVGGVVAAEVAIGDVIDPPRRAEAWRRFSANRWALGGVCVLVALVALTLFAPLIASYDPLFIPRGDARLSPSVHHWFGTDQLGRDVFSRVVFGARNSLVIGVGSAALATLIGLLVGATAGFRGGHIDALLMRLTDMFLVFPAILLAGAFAIALGRGVATLVVVLAMVGWPTVARVARGAVASATQEEWIEASRAIGCSNKRLLFKHVLPHAAGPIVVVGILYVSTAILAEATLSFLAIGIVEPTPSWGLMIAGGRSTLAIAPHIVLFPATALFLTVAALLAVADGVRDALGVEP